jgi:hypothetical protein
MFSEDFISVRRKSIFFLQNQIRRETNQSHISTENNVITTFKVLGFFGSD